MIDRAQLDLDRDEPVAIRHQQVDLDARLGAPEEGLGADDSLASQRDDLFDHQPLERMPPVVPGLEIVRPPEPGEEVQQAGVTT